MRRLLETCIQNCDLAGVPKRAIFQLPPVQEMALTVQFTQPLAFRTYDGPALHEPFGDNYPTVVEQNPVSPLTLPGKPVEIVFEPSTPRARWWFTSPDERELVQVQDDRLSRNWRRLSAVPSVEDRDYPGYEALRDRFLNDLQIFSDCTSSRGFGVPELDLCELIYINFIPMVTGTEQVRIRDILTFLRLPPKRPVIGLRMSWGHDAIRSGEELTRLYKTDLSFGTSNDIPVANLSLSCVSRIDDLENLPRVFDEVHTRIHEHFLELTCDGAQEAWGRGEVSRDE